MQELKNYCLLEAIVMMPVLCIKCTVKYKISA